MYDSKLCQGQRKMILFSEGTPKVGSAPHALLRPSPMTLYLRVVVKSSRIEIYINDTDLAQVVSCRHVVFINWSTLFGCVVQ